MYSNSKDFLIDRDNAPKEYQGERKEGHDGMQDNLDMEGSSDEVEGVEGSDDIEDVGVFP